MNRQSLRQEIVADLDRLLQAAKETKYDQVVGGIGKKTDSSGRTFYMNLNKGRRATTQEWKAVFGEDQSNVEKQQRQAQEVKGRLDKERQTVTLQKQLKDSKNYVDQMSEDTEDAKAYKQKLQSVLDKQIERTGKTKVGLGELLLDQARYNKEAVEAATAKANEELYTQYAGIHDYLTNKEDREKFNQEVVSTIDGLRNKTIEKATAFGNTVMAGIGTMLNNAQSAIDTQAKNAQAAVQKQWDELQANPEFQKRAAQLKGALDYIQTKTSPATSAVNTQISNLAFSVNMANARMTFLGYQVAGKEGSAGEKVIQDFQDKLKNLENPTSADVTKLMEEFKDVYENAEETMWATITKQAKDQGKIEQKQEDFVKEMNLLGRIAKREKEKAAKQYEYSKQEREDARQKGIKEGREAEAKRISEISKKGSNMTFQGNTRNTSFK